MSQARFEWDDPLLIEQQFAHDERAVRDAARDHCQGRLAPWVLEAFRHGRTDPAIFRETTEIGLLGPAIPEPCGETGLGDVARGRIAREVERVDSGYGSMMSMQSSLAMDPIHELGTEAQKQEVLPKLVSGQSIGCFSPSAPSIHGKVGRRAPITGEIVAGHVFRPEEDAFSEVRRLKDPFACLNSARHGIGWDGLGAAEDGFHPPRQHVLDRRQFGRAITGTRALA